MPACAYCDGEFPDKPPGRPGFPAKYCSDRCRRDNFANNPANRVPCVACGGPTSQTPGQTDAHPGLRCRKCERADNRRRVEARWVLIEGWWAEGLLLREIADRLGWSMGHIAQETDRMRRAGRDLPYRYPADRRRHMREGRARAV